MLSMNRLRWIPPRSPGRLAPPRRWAAIAGRATLVAAALALVMAPVGRTAEAAQRRSAYAITGATVITSPGNTIENATVVLRDGLIEAVGADVATPPDARVIDGSGMTVYAGWIDAYSEVAIEQEATAATTRCRDGGGPARRARRRPASLADARARLARASTSTSTPSTSRPTT